MLHRVLSVLPEHRDPRGLWLLRADVSAGVAWEQLCKLQAVQPVWPLSFSSTLGYESTIVNSFDPSERGNRELQPQEQELTLCCPCVCSKRNSMGGFCWISQGTEMMFLPKKIIKTHLKPRTETFRVFNLDFSGWHAYQQRLLHWNHIYRGKKKSDFYLMYPFGFLFYKAFGLFIINTFLRVFT